MVQTIRMPVQVYSGIAPPQALLNAMASSLPGASDEAPQEAPQQPPPQFAPSETAEEPPPSYEDAIADDLGPVDGPRRDYHQRSNPHLSNRTKSVAGVKGFSQTVDIETYESGTARVIVPKVSQGRDILPTGAIRLISLRT